MIITLLLPLGLAALGVVVSPLLGIVVDRAVERLAPRLEHRCTTCNAGLGRASLVPVVGWWQRCPACGAHKGIRYPLVDVATAITFGLLGLRFGDSLMLAPYLGFAAVLIVLSAIDIETHLLPNVITWPAFLAGLFVIMIVSGQQDYGEGVNSALMGTVVFTGFIGAAHLAYERGMGRGDVKLSLTLGLFLGWLHPSLIDTTRLVLFTILAALLGGAVVGTAYNRIRGRGRAEIPFGPALSAAAIAAVLVSGSVFETVNL